MSDERWKMFRVDDSMRLPRHGPPLGGEIPMDEAPKPATAEVAS
jgi:hypothetical protein